jgi:hypothetical protein
MTADRKRDPVEEGLAAARVLRMRIREIPTEDLPLVVEAVSGRAPVRAEARLAAAILELRAAIAEEIDRRKIDLKRAKEIERELTRSFRALARRSRS